MAKISIIIATFNASATLERCLKSIVNQLDEGIELIVIDGNSTDTTNDIISSYANKIDYTISESDKGIYDAWNKGISHSKGDWVMFVGADDVLLPDAIQKYLRVIDSTTDIDTYDYICAHNELVDTKGTVLRIIGQKPEWKVMIKRMAAAHVASLHNRKNLFETCGLYDTNLKICADYEMLLRKRDKLKYLFIDTHIAQMLVGGMSMSIRAIKETYRIRSQHKTIPSFINILLYIRDVLAFERFKLCVKIGS